jgi:hypothetical protein
MMEFRDYINYDISLLVPTRKRLEHLKSNIDSIFNINVF